MSSTRPAVRRGVGDALTRVRWQDRLGGRWAVSWQAYGIGVALNGPLLVLTGGSIGAEPVAAADMPGWAMVAVVASAATALWVLVGDQVLLRHRRQRPAPVVAVVAYHAVTGVIFACAIWFVGPLVGVSREGTLLETLVVTVAIGLWFGITMVFLLDSRQRFTQRREELLEEAVSVEVGLLQENDATQRLRSTIRARVDEATEDLRSEVTAMLGTLDPAAAPSATDGRLRDVADLMRDSAESAIRPLSHELWRQASAEFPRPSARDVLRQALLSERFWVVPTLLIVFIGYVRAGTYALGLGPGLLAVLALVAVVGLVLVAANRAIARRPRWRGAVVVLAFVASQLLGIGFTMAMAARGSDGDIGVEAFGSLIGMSISLLAPANIASLNAMREQVLARLQASTDGARARQIAQARQLAEITQQAARVLHGSLQTKLIAAAAGIDQAVASGREDLLEAAMLQVNVVLHETDADLSAAPDEVLHEVVERTCGAWQGILDITVVVEPEVADLVSPSVESVGLLVEEALANAFRHGRATKAAVAVGSARDEAGQDVLSVTVQDDGLGGDLADAGLGTALMNRLTQGRVSYDMTDEGFRISGLISR